MRRSFLELETPATRTPEGTMHNDLYHPLETAELGYSEERMIGEKPGKRSARNVEEQLGLRQDASAGRRQPAPRESKKPCGSCDDVTAALGRYTDLYEFAPVGYFTIDGAGIIRAVNLTGEHLLGMERSRLIGLRFEHLVSEETRPALLLLIERISRDQGNGACEVTLQVNGLQPLFVRIEAASCNSGRENRLAVVDISETRRTAQALQLSEARYRRLFETAKDGIMMVEADT